MALWNSRFKKPLTDSALKFSSSIDTDGRLFNEDIQGSIAHVKMLAKQKIISSDESKKILKALLEIQKEIQRKKIKLEWEKEDIHTIIEERLTKKIGEVGKKIHTGRSRNDQIATDERLYLSDEVSKIISLILDFQKVLLKKSIQYVDTIIAGYTHLQRAQPILLSHHLLAYVEMLERDKERLKDLLKRVSISPLGAGALSGTSIPIDRNFTAKLLNMQPIISNSIDAVSDRDFIIEAVSACSIIMMHLSRLSEELIIWSSQEFSFAYFDDAYATGSSLMPQKKNPDLAELIRGKTGRTFGALIGILTVMKGLPLAYNRDMQEDKFHLNISIDTVEESLSIMTELIDSTNFDRNRFQKELYGDLSLATDLTEYLVVKGVPFRTAHHYVGQIVAECDKLKCKLHELHLTFYKSVSEKFGDDIYDLFDPIKSISNKKSAGSTSFSEVKKQINKWEKLLSKK